MSTGTSATNPPPNPPSLISRIFSSLQRAWAISNATNVGRVSFWIITSIIVGVVTITIPNFSVGIWSLAALASGALLGFLFGVPRVQQSVDDGADAPRYRLTVNTNLEQISDWLILQR